MIVSNHNVYKVQISTNSVSLERLKMQYSCVSCNSIKPLSIVMQYALWKKISLNADRLRLSRKIAK